MSQSLSLSLLLCFQRIIPSFLSSSTSLSIPPHLQCLSQVPRLARLLLPLLFYLSNHPFPHCFPPFLLRSRSGRQTAVMASPGINIKALHNSTAASIMYDVMSHSGTMPPSLPVSASVPVFCLSPVKSACTAVCMNLFLCNFQFHIRKESVQLLNCWKFSPPPSCCYSNTTCQNVTETEQQQPT